MTTTAFIRFVEMASFGICYSRIRFQGNLWGLKSQNTIRWDKYLEFCEKMDDVTIVIYITNEDTNGTSGAFRFAFEKED